MLRIGAHVDQEDPIAEAVARGADLVQFFLGDPQGWDEPTVRYPGGPAALHEAAAARGVDLYVHAPYVINVATTNNRVRFPSRKLFQQTLDKAAEIGVKGVIVHGGHVLRADDPAQGCANWRKTLERAQLPVPVLLENTAGGDHAMSRRLDAIARLWEQCGEFDLGFCLDTCHAHAGGEDLLTIVDRVKAITGRIDLVHANDSKDEFDSGRDRHENLGRGQIDPQDLVGVVQAAGAPVVVETPGGRSGQSGDIAWLRERLPA